MPRNRRKPNSSRSYAGTGEKPISIDGEARLDKAIADNTVDKQNIRIAKLEEDVEKLKLQLEEKKTKKKTDSE